MSINTQSPHSLKVVILAAGAGRRSGVDFPKVLQPLGERKIIDYVVQSALRFVPPQDVVVVVGQGDQVQIHLGDEFQYVTQPEPLGTGDAVGRTASLLADFNGDVLILYGDTPLFRSSPLRGLMNRHYLKGAALTLFTAVLQRPLPYGRIIRNDAGDIVDIIEEADASEQIKQHREFNIGAYIVRAADLYPALAKLDRNNQQDEYLLTDCVRQLVRSGLTVASYQSYAEEDALGINTPADLQQAEFTLQKRLFRPQRTADENLIKFGTGGWRAVIGEGFTMHNVRRLCQTLANEVVRRNEEAQGVVIGFDRRFLSDRAAEVAAEIFAGNNIRVIFLAEDVPTPLVEFVTAVNRAAFGLIFTASHNPPQWNGLKVFHSDGSLLLTDETNRIESEANGLTRDDVVRISFEMAREAGVVETADYTNEYVDSIENLLDMEAIRRAGLRIIMDPMYGTGQVTLGIILTEARCRVTTINEQRNPLFGGRSPAPNAASLRVLITAIKEGGYDLGLAMDGDGDRIAIVDEHGEYIHINDVLLLLYYYLREVRGEKGGVVRNIATTHMLDRLAAHLGERCIEVPVGFKHITAGMLQHNAVLGGESSGGLTVRGHILGKDGIFASALVVEMLAKTGKTVSQLLDELFGMIGRLYTVEEAVAATAEMKVLIPRRLRETKLDRVGETAHPPSRGQAVIDTNFTDGTKFILPNDSWLLLRFSGTEPVLRLFAEADSLEKAQALIDWAKDNLLGA